MEVSFDSQGPLRRLDPDLESGLFRIIAEAATAFGLTRWQTYRLVVLPMAIDRWTVANAAAVERYMGMRPCPSCRGRRLRPEALAVTFAGRSIAEINAMPLTEVVALLRPVAGPVASQTLRGGLNLRNRPLRNRPRSVDPSRRT